MNACTSDSAKNTISRERGYRLSAWINGGICIALLLTIQALAVLPISPEIARSIIAGLMPVVFICGAIAFAHYRLSLSRGDSRPGA